MKHKCNRCGSEVGPEDFTRGSCGMCNEVLPKRCDRCGNELSNRDIGKDKCYTCRRVVDTYAANPIDFETVTIESDISTLKNAKSVLRNKCGYGQQSFNTQGFRVSKDIGDRDLEGERIVCNKGSAPQKFHWSESHKGFMSSGDVKEVPMTILERIVVHKILQHLGWSEGGL